MKAGVKRSTENLRALTAGFLRREIFCGKNEKMVDKPDPFGYNIPCQQRTALRAEQNHGDLHSGSAVDSDSTCGSSILSSPTRKPQSQLAAVFSGHSAVGSAPRSGRGGRGFKSRCSDQKSSTHICVLSFFLFMQRDLNRAALP